MKNALPGAHNILKKQFSNGVTVLVHENPWSTSASFTGSLAAGFCLDPADKPGLSAFVSASLTAGTRSRNFEQINEFLENIGAVLSFKSTSHVIKFSGNCLCDDLTGVLKLLREMLDEPAFPEQYMEVLKQLSLGGYDPEADEQLPVSYKYFKETLWGEDHPYGRVKSVSSELIRSFTRDDLVDFHKRFFGPKDLIISLSGGFRGQEIMDRCEEIFGSWKKPQEAVDEDELFPEVIGEDCPVRVHLQCDFQKEICFTMGSFGPAMSDPDNLSFRLGSIILGEFAGSGRIGRIVREKNGLAYSAYSYMESWKKGGCWSINAGCDPANLPDAVRLIYGELRRFVTEPVSPQELTDVKNWYIGSLPLEFGTNAGMASMIHSLAYYQRDLDHWLRIPEIIEKINPEMILQTAQKWIDPKKLVITTTGPWDNMPDPDIWRFH